MTDKKFTGAEIISSLKVIATKGNCNECKIRNCEWGTCNCSQTTANAALNLINSQKAEIEMLNKVFQASQQLINDLNKSYFDEVYKYCLTKVKDCIATRFNPYGKPDFNYDTSIKLVLADIDEVIDYLSEKEVNDIE